MARIKLALPEKFSFSTQIPVRITDINYGGHAGNDTILSFVHEARMQFIRSVGYTELNIEGIGLIMSDVAIEFKSEVFYGDVLTAFVTAAGFGRAAFDIYYKLVNSNGQTAAVAKTGMVCFDYKSKKIAGVPESFRRACEA